MTPTSELPSFTADRLIRQLRMLNPNAADVIRASWDALSIAAGDLGDLTIHQRGTQLAIEHARQALAEAGQ